MISLDFFAQEDVVFIAKSLIGKKLVTYKNEQLTSGMIVETEAYRAPEDAASHAYKMRRTQRTETMYQSPGTIYVYLIYGVYELFNIVTHQQEIPHAILIRALQPKEGVKVMQERRKLKSKSKNLTSGPGILTQSLAIHREDDGKKMAKDYIWIEDYKHFKENEIIASPRVGLGKSVVEPYLSMPWRFRLKNNSFTSKPHGFR